MATRTLADVREPSDEIIGRRVKVMQCEAAEHGNNPGCVCSLLGTVVTIQKRYETIFAGTASYHIKDSNKRVRRSEVEFPVK